MKTIGNCYITQFSNPNNYPIIQLLINVKIYSQYGEKQSRKHAGFVCENDCFCDGLLVAKIDVRTKLKETATTSTIKKQTCGFQININTSIHKTHLLVIHFHMSVCESFYKTLLVIPHSIKIFKSRFSS